MKQMALELEEQNLMKQTRVACLLKEHSQEVEALVDQNADLMEVPGEVALPNDTVGTADKVALVVACTHMVDNGDEDIALVVAAA